MLMIAPGDQSPREHLTSRGFAALLKREKNQLISDWQTKIRRLPNAKELAAPIRIDHIPALIDELIDTLEQSVVCDVLRTPEKHGRQRLRVGFDLAEVVSEYGILRGCILDLVDRNGLYLTGQMGVTLHEFIDAAVLSAVRAFWEQRDQHERTRREEYLKFIVHDLRSPLAAIYQAMMVVEHELHDSAVSDRARAMLNAVQRNIQRMQVLTIKVLQEEANIRAEAGVQADRDEIVLRPVVESVIQELQPLALTSGTKVQNIVPMDIVVYADPELLHRIFQNLISNAIEHSPAGAVTVGAAGENGGVVCWVEDNGRGMSPELKAKVLDKLPMDARRNGGTGLGLAVVRQFVEAHVGKISVESHEGDGTTFRFSIPGASESKKQPQ